jgi:hypothetical protein
MKVTFCSQCESQYPIISTLLLMILYFHLVKEHFGNGMVFTVDVGVDLLWSDTIYESIIR